MAQPELGASVPAVPEDAERAWYRWKHYHPSEAEDPHMAFGAGFRRGYRAMLVDSTRWVSLEPMLRELLDELVQARIEREYESLGVNA